MRPSRVLVVAAHPDDEVLGCGGTFARLVEEGHTGYILILGEGLTSRDEKRDAKRREKDIRALRRNAVKAGEILGAKDVFIHDFADNRFDTHPFLDIVKVIEKTKNAVTPEIVFTHYVKDLNIDHQITYKAVITAMRPLARETVKHIYSYEIPSATECNYPMSFSPDVFYDISGTIGRKLKAIGRYKGEVRNFPHPRSIKGIELAARSWGMKVGVEYAEAFKCVRSIR